MFDWTVNFGNLLTIGGFIFSGVIFVLLMRGDILVLATRLTAVEAALVKIASLMENSARQEGELRILDERVNAISRRVDEHMSIAAHDKG